jgi:actin-related protein 8
MPVSLTSVCSQINICKTVITITIICVSGDQKTSICCIEDGFGSRNTRLTLEYGGSDITQLLHHLLKQRAFPFDCKADTRTGGLFLQNLKQKLCHFNLDICGHNEQHFRVTLPEQPVLDYKILVGDECLIAPLALFYPESFALTLSSGKRMRILNRNEGHSDDPFDENYLIQTKRKYGESNEGSGQSTEPNTEPVIEDELEDTAYNDREINIIGDQHLLGLDQAILQCIDHCESEEVKKRMYSSILLVGGGLAFPGIDKWLQKRLSTQIPLPFRGNPIEIIVKPKDIDSQIVSWKGAAVMSLLDSAQEMWITSEEWRKSGIRLLREKASFVF